MRSRIAPIQVKDENGDAFGSLMKMGKMFQAGAGAFGGGGESPVPGMAAAGAGAKAPAAKPAVPTADDPMSRRLQNMSPASSGFNDTLAENGGMIGQAAGSIFGPVGAMVGGMVGDKALGGLASPPPPKPVGSGDDVMSRRMNNLQQDPGVTLQQGLLAATELPEPYRQQVAGPLIQANMAYRARGRA